MKNLFLFFLTLALFSSCQSSHKSSYLSPAFEKARAYDKTLAILPFEVVNRYKRMPKGSTIESLKSIEKEDAIIMQRDLYRYCLRAYSNNEYTVYLQNYSKTNEILEAKGIKYEDIKKIPKEELAEMLGVDAVVSGKVRQVKGKWTGGIISHYIGVLFGRGKKLNATLAIYNRENDRPIWKYNDGVSVSEEDTVLSLSRKLLRTVSQKIPYQTDMGRVTR